MASTTFLKCSIIYCTALSLLHLKLIGLKKKKKSGMELACSLLITYFYTMTVLMNGKLLLTVNLQYFRSHLEINVDNFLSAIL